MSATVNYARRGGRKIGGKVEPLEVRFFTAEMETEVPRMLLLAPWIWWRIPGEHDEVRLVGEPRSERCERLRHEPRECSACVLGRQRSGG